MAKPRTAGISGVAVAMIGAGALAIYSAIKGTSPLEEMRSLLTGKRPEPLGTNPRGDPLQGLRQQSAKDFPQGKGASVKSTRGVKPHVLAEMNYAANAWNVEVQGFGLRDNPSDHPLGLAMDVMVPELRGTVGDSIAEHYKANAAAKHVKYVIWNRKIWSVARASEGWRSRPWDLRHDNHVHVSFFNWIRGRVGR